jgi:hypothetical protein
MAQEEERTLKMLGPVAHPITTGIMPDPEEQDKRPYQQTGKTRDRAPDL